MFICSIKTAARAAAIMVVLVTGVATLASAQDGGKQAITDKVLACGRITGLSQRLVCFDSIVENLKQSQDAATTISTTTMPPVVAVAASPSTSRTPVVPPTGTPTAPSASTPTPTPTVASASTPTPTVASASTPTPTVASASEPAAVVANAPTSRTTTTAEDEFGLEPAKVEAEEQKKVEKKEEFESLQATVVRAWKNPTDGRFAVELDNGQTWRETSGSRSLMPKQGKTVEITKSRFGGYRMKIEGIKRLASVRRSK